MKIYKKEHQILDLETLEEEEYSGLGNLVRETHAQLESNRQKFLLTVQTRQREGYIFLELEFSENSFNLEQIPAINGVRVTDFSSQRCSFEIFKQILEKGFNGRKMHNFKVRRSDDYFASLNLYGDEAKQEIIIGDRFYLEAWEVKGERLSDSVVVYKQMDVPVDRVEARDIVAKILIKDGVTPEELDARILFYRTNLLGFNVPYETIVRTINDGSPIELDTTSRDILEDAHLRIPKEPFWKRELTIGIRDSGSIARLWYDARGNILGVGNARPIADVNYGLRLVDVSCDLSGFPRPLKSVCIPSDYLEGVALEKLRIYWKLRQK